MKKSIRAMISGIITIVHVLTLFCAVLPMHAGAISAADISAFVDFDNVYPDVENRFTVWGEYAGKEETEIQILSAVYNSKGQLLQADVGEKIMLEPQTGFAVDDSIVLDEDADLSDAVLKVFLWDSVGGMQALGKSFLVTDTSFTYTLDGDARTSGGVFDEEGNLIRTLWSGVEEKAGTYTKTWDGLDDNGVLQADGTYNITVLENNVEIKVDSFIGNTSDHSNYDYILSGYSGFLSDMMYVDGKVFYIYPYSEGRPAVYYFNQENPDRKAGEFGGSYRCMQRAVTDGRRMYVINTEVGMDHVFRTFVYAYDLSSKQLYMFENQGDWVSSWGIDNHYYAVNVITHDESLFQTGGMGVQTHGDLLFVSYVSEGKVYVLNKYTGELICSTDFNQPRGLAYNENGGLWIGYKQDNGQYVAQRFDVAADGQLTEDTSIALEDEFGYLAHLELSPDGEKIVVADASTNQYKMYSTETGELLWTYGSGESYEEDPTIYPDKLMLKYTSNETDLVYSEFEDDDTLWIGDVGNNRAYKLDISTGEPEVIDEIMMQPGSHSLGVDLADPTNLYSNAIQYKIDYRKSGNEAWTPVKNWKKQVEKYNISTISLNQFNNMITLPNGRTYFSAWHDNGTKWFYFDENSVHLTDISFDNRVLIDEETIGSITPEGSMAVHRLHKITGYDAQNNPIIEEPGTIIAKLPIDWTEPTHIFGGTKLNMPISENNVMLSLRCILQKDVNDRKTWHVGGVQLGDDVATEWTWKAAPEGSEFYSGNFPTDGTFEAGNNVLNTAQTIVANGSNVIFQYNGEFYRSLQTNKLYFYRDNGLLVGMFGEATRQRLDYDERHLYGKEIYPGNAFDMYFIQDEEDTDRAYIVQNNENGFGNFKYNVTGLDSIQEHKTDVQLKTTLCNGLTYRYYIGDSTVPTNMVTKGLRSTVTREPFVAGDDFEMRYTGYIQNPNGGGNLKLSINTKEEMELRINSKQLFNGTGAASPEIYLEAGKFYPFSCTIKKSNSTSGSSTRVVLGYYNAQNKMLPFEEAHFKTNAPTYENPRVVQIDLLEDLPFASVINSGEYGFTRSTPGNVDGISLNTNTINDSFDEPRDINFTANLWPEENGWWPQSAWVEKSLGTPRENLEAWEINMDLSRTGYVNYGNLYDKSEGTGINIDVLDVNDKVIARFYWAKRNTVYGNNYFIYQSDSMTNNNITNELYSVPGDYHNDFNTPSLLKIRAVGGNIIFECFGQREVTPILDSEAEWDKPAKVKLDAFFNYDQTQAREMSMAISRFDYTQHIAEPVEEEEEIE